MRLNMTLKINQAAQEIILQQLPLQVDGENRDALNGIPNLVFLYVNNNRSSKLPDLAGYHNYLYRQVCHNDLNDYNFLISDNQANQLAIKTINLTRQVLNLAPLNQDGTNP